MSSHFLDVGSNCGQTFTDYLNKDTKYDGWTVWCFEPSPRHIPALMEEARRQSSRYTVKVCPFGVYSFTGSERFFQKDDPMGDSFQPYLASDHVTENLETGYELICPVVKLSDFIPRHIPDGEYIELKIDAEGSEYGILYDLLEREKMVDRIMVEWHQIDPSGKDDRLELIERYRKIGKELEPWLL